MTDLEALQRPAATATTLMTPWTASLERGPGDESHVPLDPPTIVRDLVNQRRCLPALFGGILTGLLSCTPTRPPPPASKQEAVEDPDSPSASRPRATNAASPTEVEPSAASTMARRDRCVAQIPQGTASWVASVGRAFCTEAATTATGGSSMAISDGDRLVLSLEVGETCERSSPPITRETVFRWGSISKVLTTLTVLVSLEETSGAPLKGSIGRWLPELQGHWSAGIPLVDLLSHTSGLTGLPAMHTYENLDAVLVDIRRLPAPSQVRPAYAYGNVNYVLAAQIVERISSRSWDDAVRETVLRPLGLDAVRTELDLMAHVPAKSSPPSMACNRRSDGGQTLEIPIGPDYASRLSSRPWLRPAGAVVSDAISLSTLGALWLSTDRTTALSRAAAIMLTPMRPLATDDPEPVLGHPWWPGVGIYLLGVTTPQDADRCAPRFHRGEAGAFRAHLWVFPSCDASSRRTGGFSLAILDNAGRPFGATLATAIGKPPR